MTEPSGPRPGPIGSASLSSTATEPELLTPATDTAQLQLLISMQHSLDLANRRSDEANRRSEEALKMIRELIQQRAQHQPLSHPSPSSFSVALPPAQHPMLFLPPRMLHPLPTENPSSAESLLNAFLQERRTGDLIHKKIKSFEDWMKGMDDGMKRALAAGNMGAVLQSVKYITLMSNFNTTYGWAAADCYWYELQKEVDAGYHSLLVGSPWNARAFTTMTSNYQSLSGRPTQSTLPPSSSSSSSSSASPSSQPHSRSQDLECSHHGENSSHTTADCKFLASHKAGGPTAKSS